MALRQGGEHDEPFDPVAMHSLHAKFYKYRTPYAPEMFASLAKKLPLGAKSNILDLCCGSGEIAASLSRYVGQITAVDGSEEMLALAPKLANVRYALSDVNSPSLVALLWPHRFQHFTIGRAIHWIEPCAMNGLVDRCLARDGGIIIINSGWDSSTEWIEEYKRVRIAYDRNIEHDWRGSHTIASLRSSGFKPVDSICIMSEVSCGIGYLIDHALSYATTADGISANLEAFRSDVSRALKPYLRGGQFVGNIASSAVICRR